MSDYAARFPSLSFDTPAEGVLRITLDAPGLNAVSPDCHAHLADVWLALDAAMTSMARERGRRAAEEKGPF